MSPALAAMLLLALALSLLVSAPASANRQTAMRQVGEKAWEFERFDTDIQVNTDGSLSVRETQVVNFTGSFSFLNRDLVSTKASFSDGRSYGRVRYSDIKVYDIDKKPTTFKVEKLKGGKRVHLSFTALNEQKGWIIEYRMTGAIIYSKDYDRLYFNTVTTDRSVPIKSSRTTVSLPAGIDMANVKTKEYVNEASPPSSVTSGRDGDKLWWEAKDISPYTTLTIDVAFPKGYVAVPLTYRAWFGALMISFAAILAFGFLAGMILLWYRKGRDVAAPELDVVQYTPPPDLKPMEVAYLVNEGTLSPDITATIVDLAIHGRLVITEQEGGTIIKHAEYGFQKRQVSEEGLEPFEQAIMNGLFASGDSVTQDDLEDKFYTHISGIESKLKEQVLSKGFFDGDPNKVKAHYRLIGFALLLLIVPVAYSVRWFDLGYAYTLIPAFAIAGLSMMIVGRYMSRRTAKGSQALSYVNGYKDYMGTAEREELKLMTPENFQENLPYAMVLKVAGPWAEKFKDIYTSPPDWFVSYYPGATFSTVYLASSLSTMQTAVGSTLTSSPSSSSSGGGGGFGGGSSGGGFGGGGSSAG
jgi:uncharacterized membrane protein YgcG